MRGCKRIARAFSTTPGAKYDVVIVGAGSAGTSVASTLLASDSSLRVALIDPAKEHHYQPGWTFVGSGIFTKESCTRPMQSVVPAKAQLLQDSVASFSPEDSAVTLASGARLGYERLVVCPGIHLAWEDIDGLNDTLGSNGVTSNYKYGMADYTWDLVQKMKQGRATFTQPAMPIKCAGAPQKAVYLSSDYWLKKNVLQNIQVSFCLTPPVLFGVPQYVPALMKYIKKYNVSLQMGETLVSVNGPAKTATFKVGEELQERSFDMLHVVPPQKAPAFIRDSPLASSNGFLDVDQHTLRHTKFSNVWGVGDVINTTNAKTMAAVRKQSLVVAHNMKADIEQRHLGVAKYDGYGSCPLTVEKGKIVLAEFGYGGKLLPTVPTWVNDGTKPTSLAWELKEKVLPPYYWNVMLSGKHAMDPFAQPTLDHSEAFSQ